MGKFCSLVCCLMLTGCVYVRVSAKVEGVGVISKSVIAVGNTKIQEASQKLEGYLEKDGVVIQFGSESRLEIESKEELLTFLGGIAKFL